MKQITILIAALVLTFTDLFSTELIQKSTLSDFNQYALLSAEGDFSFNPNYNEFTIENAESTSENTVDKIELNNESFQSETVTETNKQNSDDELFDRSAGAMGLGIF